MRRTFRKTFTKAFGPLLAAVLVASLLGVPIGAGFRTIQSVSAAGPSLRITFQVPKGQLTRRAISGKVVSKSASSMVVSTKHGNVTVNLSAGTLVNAPPDKDVGIGAIQVGDKVGVLLDRSPSTPAPEPSDESDGDTGGTTVTTTDTGGTTVTTTDTGDTGGTTVTTTDTGTGDTGGTTVTTTDTGGTTTTTDSGTGDSGTEASTDDGTGGEDEDEEPVVLAESFRTVTATRVSIAPGKATREHERGITKCKDVGVLEVVGEDGEITEVEDADCKGKGSGSDDSILLKRKKSRDSDEFEIRGKKPTADVDLRIKGIKDKLASSTADRLELIEEREAERAEKEQARIDRLGEKATGRAKDLLDDAEDRKGKRKRGEDVDDGSGGDGTGGDDSSDTGKGNSGGGSKGGGSDKGGGIDKGKGKKD